MEEREGGAAALAIPALLNETAFTCAVIGCGSGDNLLSQGIPIRLVCDAISYFGSFEKNGKKT